MSTHRDGAVIAHRIFPDWAWMRRSRSHAYTCPLLLTLAMKWRRWRTGKEIHWTGYRPGRLEPLRICYIVRRPDGGWHGVEMSARLPLWMIFAEFCFWRATDFLGAWRAGRIPLRTALRYGIRSVAWEWRTRRSGWVWGGRTWWSRS